MRSLLDPLSVFSTRGATENARRELVRVQNDRAQTTVLARRIATIDVIAGRAAVRAASITDAA